MVMCASTQSNQNFLHEIRKIPVVAHHLRKTQHKLEEDRQQKQDKKRGADVIGCHPTGTRTL